MRIVRRRVKVLAFWRTLCICYIVIFLIIISMKNKIRVTKKQIRVFFIVFSFSLAVLSYFMNPPDNWDITRHAIYIDRIRHSEASFLDFTFGKKSVIGGSSYSGLCTFNALCYIAAHVSDNNYFISALFVFIDYTIVGYIMIDWSENNEASPNAFGTLTLLVSFSFLPYIFASSGLRNALSACLIGLGIYLYLYKSKHILCFIILSVLSVTVHPATLITIPFVFIAKLNIGIAGYVVVFGVTVASNTLAKWMSLSDILYFQKIGQKYFFYISEAQYQGARVILYSVIIMIVIYIVVYFLISITKSLNAADNKTVTINRFLAIYMIYIIGNIGNYDMVVRPTYVLGPLSPVFCSLVFDGFVNYYNFRTRKLIQLGLSVSCFSLLLYMQIKIMPEAIKAYVFS